MANATDIVKKDATGKNQTVGTIDKLMSRTCAGVGVQSNVAASASAVTVLAANTNRAGAVIYNDSAQILYLLLSASQTPSSSLYTVQVPAMGTYNIPFSYTGIVKGVWALASGNARVTELTYA